MTATRKPAAPDADLTWGTPHAQQAYAQGWDAGRDAFRDGEAAPAEAENPAALTPLEVGYRDGYTYTQLLNQRSRL